MGDKRVEAVVVSENGIQTVYPLRIEYLVTDPSSKHHNQVGTLTHFDPDDTQNSFYLRFTHDDGDDACEWVGSITRVVVVPNLSTREEAQQWLDQHSTSTPSG